MTHTRYWAVTLIAATAGGFLAVNQYAFRAQHAVWIAFGVAIAAGVCCLAGTIDAFVRQNQPLSGLSAVGALLAAFTVIATRAFTAPTALWLAFAGGLAVLLVSLRALALHEATVERVVHSLELNGSGRPVAVRPSQPAAGTPFARLRDELEISGQMRSWADWLANTAVGLAGTFVVLTTFAWQQPVPAVDPRWVWFGMGAIGAALPLAVLLEQALAAYNDGINLARAAELAVTTAAGGVAGALTVTMALHASIDYRWTAFGLGAAMVGVSLAAALIHELTSERVRHELETQRPTALQAQSVEAA